MKQSVFRSAALLLYLIFHTLTVKAENTILPADTTVIDSVILVCKGERIIYKGVIYGLGRVIRDTVYNGNDIDSIITISIQSKPKATISLTGTAQFCEGDSTQLKVETDAELLFWNTGQKSRTIIVKDSGYYWAEGFSSSVCPSRDSIYVKVDPAPKFDLNLKDESCFGVADGEIQITLTDSTNGPYDYFVNDDMQTDNNIVGLRGGNYIVEVINQFGCSSTMPADIKDGHFFQIELGPDFTSQKTDTSVVISAQTNNGVIDSLWWRINGQDTMILGPRFRMEELGTQTIVVGARDTSGCLDFDTLEILVDIPNLIFTPNVFSPNNDGLNDYLSFYSVDKSLVLTNVQIFDRWGQLIHHSQDQEFNNDKEGWDGTFQDKMLNPGVYIYRIEYEHPDQGSITYKGAVTLVR